MQISDHPRFIRVIRVSKIATPDFATEVHTVFCTPSTDDWTGGVTRLQPLTRNSSTPIIEPRS